MGKEEERLSLKVRSILRAEVSPEGGPVATQTISDASVLPGGQRPVPLTPFSLQKCHLVSQEDIFSYLGSSEALPPPCWPQRLTCSKPNLLFLSLLMVQ